MDGIETPELDRMKDLRYKSQPIGEFLDSAPYVLAQWIDCEAHHGGGDCEDGEHLVAVGRSIEAVLAEYFEIDLAKVEQERRAILAAIQAAAVERERGQQ